MPSDPETGNLLTGVAVAVSAVGNLLGGLLLTRGVRRPVILIGGGFVAMALRAFGVLDEGIPGGVAYALCLLFSASAGLIPVALLDAAGRYAPRPDLVGATVGFMMRGDSAGLVSGRPRPRPGRGRGRLARGRRARGDDRRNRGCAHHGASGDPGRNGGPDMNLGRECSS